MGVCPGGHAESRARALVCEWPVWLERASRPGRWVGLPPPSPLRMWEPAPPRSPQGQGGKGAVLEAVESLTKGHVQTPRVSLGASDRAQNPAPHVAGETEAQGHHLRTSSAELPTSRHFGDHSLVLLWGRGPEAAVSPPALTVEPLETCPSPDGPQRPHTPTGAAASPAAQRPARDGAPRLAWAPDTQGLGGRAGGQGWRTPP